MTRVYETVCDSCGAHAVLNEYCRTCGYSQPSPPESGEDYAPPNDPTSPECPADFHERDTELELGPDNGVDPPPTGQ